MVNSENLTHQTNKYVYNFQQFETIKSLTKNISLGNITLNDSDKNKKYLLFENGEILKSQKSTNLLKS